MSDNVRLPMLVDDPMADAVDAAFAVEVEQPVAASIPVIDAEEVALVDRRVLVLSISQDSIVSEEGEEEQHIEESNEE